MANLIPAIQPVVQTACHQFRRGRFVLLYQFQKCHCFGGANLQVSRFAGTLVHDSGHA